jgi:hypothetical protein
MRQPISAVIYAVLLGTSPPLNAAQLDDANPSATPPPMAVGAQLRPAPEGFVWRAYRGALFARPSEWHERTAVQAVTKNGIPVTVYAASPEEFSETKQFEMGMTIQAIVQPRQIAKVDASKMAYIYLQPFLEAHKPPNVLLVDRSKKGDFENLWFRYRDAPSGQTPIVVHKFVVANDRLDFAYVFTFESPEATWEENWTKFGTPFLKNLNFLGVKK